MTQICEEIAMRPWTWSQKAVMLQCHYDIIKLSTCFKQFILQMGYKLTLNFLNSST